MRPELKLTLRDKGKASEPWGIRDDTEERLFAPEYDSPPTTDESSLPEVIEIINGPSTAGKRPAPLSQQELVEGPATRVKARKTATGQDRV